MNISEAKEKLDEIVSRFKGEMNQLRLGRANPEILDSVQVEVYESTMPIKHIANISTPDPRTILIQPWDKTNLKSIEKAIFAADIDITPIVDGETIRISIPSMTQEIRENYVKDVKIRTEESKVAVRQVRHKIMEELDNQLKSGGVSEDDIERKKDEFEKHISSIIDNIDEFSDKKQDEILNM
ncbi:ribosome recycling factor [Candidatus Dojkabacteria bacterium]|nr:ribosome recycling factor [Candidatus Dojkabacteria bacterium]